MHKILTLSKKILMTLVTHQNVHCVLIFHDIYILVFTQH